jgi:hypothetical protein
MACSEAGQHCVAILSNDVRSEAGFADLVNTGVRYDMATPLESREFAVSSSSTSTRGTPPVGVESRPGDSDRNLVPPPALAAQN